MPSTYKYLLVHRDLVLMNDQYWSGNHKINNQVEFFLNHFESSSWMCFISSRTLSKKEYEKGMKRQILEFEQYC